MLAKLITVWPGGPTIALGEYFVWFKYAFTFLFVAWAVGVSFRGSRRYVLLGTLALASFAWLAFSIPLERIYGLVEGEAALSELAPPMVTASRVSASDGMVVGEPNPWPLWSWFLAAAAAFSPERLLSTYFWVPLGSLLFLSVATYGWLSHLRTDGSAGWDLSPSLAVFFLLFLSAPRLSFLEEASPIWKEAFWLRPRVAFSIGLFFLALRQVQSSRGLAGHALAGSFLALVVWNDWRLGALGVIGFIVWFFAAGRLSRGTLLGLLALAPSLFVYLTTSAPGVDITASEVTWKTAAVSVLSVTVDSGLVFLLAVYGFVCLIRENRSSSAPLVWLTGTTFALYLASASSETANAILGGSLQKTLLRVLLSAVAGIGLHQCLLLVDGKRDLLAAALKPGRVSSISPDVLGLTIFLCGSLPWCFPYWWYPLEMDGLYTASLGPVSRQGLELGRWTREETPVDAVFAAGPSYAPWIAALAGRRVLAVDGADAARDPSRRRNAQAVLRETRDPRRLKAVAEAWGVTHLAWGRLDDQAAPGNHAFLASSGVLSMVHQQGRWVRVYELRGDLNTR